VTTIVIVGGGFCGVSIAIRALRSSEMTDCTVVVIDRMPRLGQGVAYGTTSPYHLLNAPAGSMSAFEEVPTDFVEFCKRVDPTASCASYVSRRLYGEYMEFRLGEAEQCSDVRLVRVHGVVENVSDSSDRESACVRLADGRKFDADYVILATGDAPQGGQLPPGSGDDIRSAYVEDPWQPHAMDGVDGGVSLVLGSGLTAIDVAIQLVKEQGVRKVVLLSRRGLRPHSHITMPTLGNDSAVALPRNLTQDGLVGKLRAVRTFARAHQLAGGDWRTAVSDLRNLAPDMWRSLTHRDKARFVRRLRPFWDIHRHRCAPATAQTFDWLVENGKIEFIVGKLFALHKTRAGVLATVCSRKSHDTRSLIVDQLINCTGPAGRGSVAQGSLLCRLMEDGVVTLDTVGIGIETTGTYRVIGNNGRSANSIFYVGPLLRARYWEATAVPELRMHCTELFNEVLRECVAVERGKRRDDITSQETHVAANP